MVFGIFGGSGKGESIPDLIKRKKFARAVELVRAELARQPTSERHRQQLAELLHLDGKTGEAVAVLRSLADEYAAQGFTVKAIAILKKIQRIDPSDPATDSKLTTMLEERESQIVSRSIVPGEELEIGIEMVEEVAPAAAEAPPPPPSPTPAAAKTGIEATPLFQSLSQPELLAVVRGFQLQSYEPGDIIVGVGAPGDSLFVIASGVVKAFIRGADNRYKMVREMGEGDFFGEISILSGKPRTATITAAEWCELLELDRATLDRIAVAHPKVMDVLKDFYRQRVDSPAESAARTGESPGGSH